MESEGYEVYSDPAFKRFLREIGKAPFTTVEEERQLHSQLKQPGVLRERAQRRLVESHMRLVVAVAANFVGRGISLQDLVQDGVVGLYDALDKFDPDRGRFKTYASWWVRMRMLESLQQLSRTVRLPASVQNKLRALKKLQDEFARHGTMPTSEQLAAALGVDQQKLRQLEMAALGTTSLDSPIAGKDDELTLADVIADDSVSDPAEAIDGEAIVAALRQALDTLEEREKDIVLKRFGFVGDQEQTLEQLAVTYGVSRERIRQIEAKAVQKLRSNKNGPLLKLLAR